MAAGPKPFEQVRGAQCDLARIPWLEWQFSGKFNTIGSASHFDQRRCAANIQLWKPGRRFTRPTARRASWRRETNHYLAATEWLASFERRGRFAKRCPANHRQPCVVPGIKALSFTEHQPALVRVQ